MQKLLQSKILKISLLIIFILLVLIASFNREHFTKEALLAVLHNPGPITTAIYLLLYAIAPAFFIPGLPFAIVAGYIFGPVWGAVYGLIGSTLGASLAFLVSRYLLADSISDYMQKNSQGILADIKSGIEKNDWKFIVIARLIPGMPYNVQNFAFGLTQIPFYKYTITSFIAMLPGAAIYSYVGYLGKQASAAEDWVLKISIGLSILISMGLAPLLLKEFKQRQKK